jgi:hypothetical protein
MSEFRNALEKAIYKLRKLERSPAIDAGRALDFTHAEAELTILLDNIDILAKERDEARADVANLQEAIGEIESVFEDRGIDYTEGERIAPMVARAIDQARAECRLVKEEFRCFIEGGCAEPDPLMDAIEKMKEKGK